MCLRSRPLPMPEINVTLFEPELTVAKSGPAPPVNCPTRSAVGLVPTGKTVGSWSLKKPLPIPGRSKTWFALASAMRRSGWPFPLMSASAVATGPTPASRRGPGKKVKLFPTFWLKRIETSFEPLLATIKSRRSSRR